MHEETITATVIHGYRNGSKFGFPTANLRIDSPLDLDNGVYAAAVWVDNIFYKGMLYIGTRPTLNLAGKTYELHLLDFSGNLYDKQLTFSIILYIRPERHFNSVEELIEQLKRDRETIGGMDF